MSQWELERVRTQLDEFASAPHRHTRVRSPGVAIIGSSANCRRGPANGRVVAFRSTLHHFAASAGRLAKESTVAADIDIARKRDGRWTVSTGPASERHFRPRQLVMTQLARHGCLRSPHWLGTKHFADDQMPAPFARKLEPISRRCKMRCRGEHMFRLSTYSRIWLLDSLTRSRKRRQQSLRRPLSWNAPGAKHCRISGMPYQCWRRTFLPRRPKFETRLIFASSSL